MFTISRLNNPIFFHNYKFCQVKPDVGPSAKTRVQNHLFYSLQNIALKAEMRALRELTYCADFKVLLVWLALDIELADKLTLAGTHSQTLQRFFTKIKLSRTED